jgi:CRISPR/Cas system CSM-associated protein Csm3 (group 7 of RAMP superfamily)
MNQQGHKLIIYEFSIEAVSPVFFGAVEPQELVKDSQGAPILFGNSIGGALRDCLEACDVPEDTVYTYMGGNRNNEFLPSLLYISDGKITGCHEFGCQEGTAIDPACGSAKKNHKYTLEYLPVGSVITFRIECEAGDYAEETEFHTIIGTWAQGFRTGSIRLGGQQNNGWGQFQLKELKKKEFVFRTPDDLDEYIKYIVKQPEQSFISVNAGELPRYEMAQGKKVAFSLEGEFPYGLYQAFADKKDSQLTGLQKRGDSYYLLASSFKGIVRSEVRVLLGKFLGAEKVDAKLEEIFGNQDRKGKIRFADVVLENSGPVKVKRFDKEQKPFDGKPVYIKIDRLTGGAFDGALKQQREIWGSALLQCQLTLEQEQDQALLFPLIYVLRRIGSGLVPLGGRTAAGLGEFTGSQVKLTGEIEENVPTGHHLSPQQINRMRTYYNAFERWCGSQCDM